MYDSIVWANKAANHKKQLERVQRLGLLGMVRVWHSTATADPEAILDVMLLDLFVQCAGVLVVLRVWDRNQRSWDGIPGGGVDLAHQALMSVKPLNVCHKLGQEKTQPRVTPLSCEFHSFWETLLTNNQKGTKTQCFHMEQFQFQMIQNADGGTQIFRG